MSANFVHYVEDACGDKFLFTVAGEEYGPKFRKFAQRWIADHKRPSAKRKSNPIFPVKIVIEPS